MDDPRMPKEPSYKVLLEIDLLFPSPDSPMPEEVYSTIRSVLIEQKKAAVRGVTGEHPPIHRR